MFQADEQTYRRIDRHEESNISSLFEIFRRRLNCLPLTHAVHLYISMILRKIFHSFHEHHQRLFQYNQCFDKPLYPNPKTSATNRHVDLHVKCLLCLKSFSTNWHVSTHFSKIRNTKFYDELFNGPGVFRAYTLAAGRMK